MQQIMFTIDVPAKTQDCGKSKNKFGLTKEQARFARLFQLFIAFQAGVLVTLLVILLVK